MHQALAARSAWFYGILTGFSVLQREQMSPLLFPGLRVSNLPTGPRRLVRYYEAAKLVLAAEPPGDYVTAKRKGPREASIAHTDKGMAVVTADGMAVNVTGLPPTPLSGFADRCAVSTLPHALDITFFDSATNRSALRVIISRGPVAAAISEASKDFLTQTTKWVKDHDISVPELSEGRPAAVDPGLAFPCTIARPARVGPDAELDLFYVSVGAVARAMKVKKPVGVPVEPLGRVAMPLTLVIAFLNRISKDNA